jgi:diaminopimelate decarboxylase
MSEDMDALTASVPTPFLLIDEKIVRDNIRRIAVAAIFFLTSTIRSYKRKNQAAKQNFAPHSAYQSNSPS